MIAAVIVACEIAFWLAIALGLTLRYPARRPRLGLGVLVSVPVIDVALLIAVAADLQSGATATAAHSVAMFYLGFSLTYGHRMIGWLDVRFAHRFADGPAPVRPTGRAYTRLCWGDVVRTTAACASASALTWALTFWIDAPDRTQALETTYGWSLLLVAAETLWALSYTFWPRRPRARDPIDSNARGDQ